MCIRDRSGTVLGAGAICGESFTFVYRSASVTGSRNDIAVAATEAGCCRDHSVRRNGSSVTTVEMARAPNRTHTVSRDMSRLLLRVRVYRTRRLSRNDQTPSLSATTRTTKTRPRKQRDDEVCVLCCANCSARCLDEHTKPRSHGF